MVQGITYVAWWGAVIATFVFIWDVVKWLKSGPHIKKRIQLDTVYPDSKVLRVEEQESGESRELAAHCHIEIVNTGTLPTTIISILAMHKPGKKEGQMSFTYQRFTPHYGKTLPHVLSPGEVWSCRLEMSDLYQLLERGEPYIQVFVSHKNKPVLIKLKYQQIRQINRRQKALARIVNGKI